MFVAPFFRAFGWPSISRAALLRIPVGVVLVAALLALTQPSAEAATPTSLKMLTFNVAGANPAPQPAGEANKTAATIASNITSQGYAVTVLQEVCAVQAYRLRDLLGSRYQVTFTTTRSRGLCDNYLTKTDRQRGYGQRFGLAIIVKTSSKLTDRTVTALPWGKETTYKGNEPRSLMCVTARVSSRPLRVCNTHLGFGRDQTAQVARVAQVMRSAPSGTVLGCDCNATATSATVKTLLDAGLVSAGATGIDHIFVKKPGEVVSKVAYYPLAKSDHAAARATLGW